MAYSINGVPVCGITFNFFAPPNSSASSIMLSHGSVTANDYGSRAIWIRLPFPIKVYALSITTDADSEGGVNMTLQVRKDTGATYTSNDNHGTGIGDVVTYTSLDERHHEYHIFSSEPTLAKNDSIGLRYARTGGSSNMDSEYTVKLWCYQI